MDRLFAVIAAFFMAVAIIVGLGLLFAIPVFLLWNWCLVGAIDGVHEINWFQAWGLNVLCNCLFKTSISKKD